MRPPLVLEVEGAVTIAVPVAPGAGVLTDVPTVLPPPSRPVHDDTCEALLAALGGQLYAPEVLGEHTAEKVGNSLTTFSRLAGERQPLLSKMC